MYYNVNKLKFQNHSQQKIKLHISHKNIMIAVVGLYIEHRSCSCGLSNVLRLDETIYRSFYTNSSTFVSKKIVRNTKRYRSQFVKKVRNRFFNTPSMNYLGSGRTYSSTLTGGRRKRRGGCSNWRKLYIANNQKKNS